MKSKGFPVIQRYYGHNIGTLHVMIFFNASNGRFFRSFENLPDQVQEQTCTMIDCFGGISQVSAENRFETVQDRFFLLVTRAFCVAMTCDSRNRHQAASLLPALLKT